MKCVDCPEYKACRRQNDLRRKRHKCSKAHEPFVKTNADRIRAMSDEELAEMIDAFNDYFGMCNRSQIEVSCMDCELHEVCCLLKGEALDWLRQPVKDGEGS